jgi:26S proteasome regulatory subunit T2
LDPDLHAILLLCLCAVFPTAKCRLRLLKLERIKDFLLLEEEYIKNQEVFKPREEKDQEERTKVSANCNDTAIVSICSS